MPPTDLKQCEEKFFWHPVCGVSIADNHQWEEVFSDAKRQVLRCRICGKESVGTIPKDEIPKDGK